MEAQAQSLLLPSKRFSLKANGIEAHGLSVFPSLCGCVSMTVFRKTKAFFFKNFDKVQLPFAGVSFESVAHKP